MFEKPSIYIQSECNGQNGNSSGIAIEWFGRVSAILFYQQLTFWYLYPSPSILINHEQLIFFNIWGLYLGSKISRPNTLLASQIICEILFLIGNGTNISKLILYNFYIIFKVYIYTLHQFNKHMNYIINEKQIQNIL